MRVFLILKLNWDLEIALYLYQHSILLFYPPRLLLRFKCLSSHSWINVLLKCKNISLLWSVLFKTEGAINETIFFKINVYHYLIILDYEIVDILLDWLAHQSISYILFVDSPIARYQKQKISKLFDKLTH